MFFKKKKEREEVRLDEKTNALVDKETGTVTFLRKELTTGKDSIGMLEAFSEQNKMPVFKGHVEHAYESDFLKYKHKCPRCGAPTEQRMSNFPYATQGDPRILTGPAGHFCTECPTVIIDDDVMKGSIDSRTFAYGGVFAVDSGYSDICMFKTLNGEQTLYILDDIDKVGGISQSVHMVKRADSFAFDDDESGSFFKKLSSGVINYKKKAKNRSKNKQAKRSRKQNRKK